jgi:hypothetical protein
MLKKIRDWLFPTRRTYTEKTDHVCGQHYALDAKTGDPYCAVCNNDLA